MPGDSRKDFVLVTTANYFGVMVNDSAITNLFNSPPLNSFLDDGNVMVLAGKLDPKKDKKIDFLNKVEASDSKERVIVFFKIRPESITPDNLQANVIVSSMIDSPLNTLYHAVQKVYAPLLLDDGKYSRNIDPKLQSLLSELEAGLGSAIRKRDPSFKGRTGEEENLGSILTPMDEFQYWQDMTRSNAGGGDLREAAESYTELFAPISKDYGGLDSLSLQDGMELVEITQDTLDDLWKQGSPPYPEHRMRHLMEIIAGSLGRYVQQKLASVNMWTGQFSSVRESLRMGVSLCERWTTACETLTSQFWKRYGPHPWKGETCKPKTLVKLGARLEEILSIRTVHEQLLRLLTAQEQKELSVSEAFTPFLGLNPLQYNPYTQPLWAAAVQQYERSMEPSQQRIAGKLRNQFRQLDQNPQQLLREFQRYKELVRRPTITKELIAERETLLGQLITFVRQVNEDFNSCTGKGGKDRIPKGKNNPEVVNNIIYVKQLEAKIDETKMIADVLLGDLNGYQKFQKDMENLKEDLQNWRRDQFDEWSQEIQSLIEDQHKPLSLETSGKLMELNHKDGKLRVNYSDRLVTLLREVRQLSSIGFSVPAKIQQVAETAQKFYRYGVILKQVGNFYNTIDQQMLPSQQAMMLDSALAFEKLVKNPKTGVKSKGDNVQVTWDNPEQLEHYIKKLQTAADRLSTENRKLRKVHFQISDKVQELMSVDLLRQQQRWKDGLMDIRHIMANLVQQGFASENMTPWKSHWDRQLYKALEHQYLMGLEALNENLPEIRVELTYRQQKLQFRPPFEEIKAKYFREMKKFISIPNHFKGVGDGGPDLIFPAIIDRNGQNFITCYRKANQLFTRLAAVEDQFKDWVVLGAIDLDQFVEDNLKELVDWEKNFRALKGRGRDAEKLPNVVKVDCITVSTTPVKSVIDDLIQRLFDALLNSLRKSINKDVSQIDGFVSTATETLSQRPQTVQEIGEANAKHTEFMATKKEVKPLFDKAESKNKLLRSVAGGGVESLTQLQSRWDKFEIMMESHQLMVKEQVEVMKNNVLARVKAFHQEVEKFSARWHQLKPGNDALEGDKETLDKAVAVIKEKRQEFVEIEENMNKIVSDCQHFDLEKPDFSAVEDLKADMASCEGMWSLYEEFNSGLQNLAKEDWISFRSKAYLFEEFLGSWYEKLKTRETTTMTVKILKDIETYKTVLPVLKWVRGEPLSQDHWLEMFRLLQMPRGTTLEKLTFGHILAVSENIIRNAEAIKELNQRAQGEVTIREAIRELELWGAGAIFAFTEYVDSNKNKMNLIKDWKDLVNQVGDNQCLLQSLKDSPYYKSFEDKASVWEQRLADLDEYLHNLNQIQRKWVYLEPIFGRGALPKEQGRFKRVDDDFRAIMRDVNRDNRVLSLVNQSGLRNLLVTMLDQLQRCQKSLNEFLEEKRSLFPRFYFIGDDDLLEILGQATNPTVIQSHLKKLFAGIHSVDFDEDNSHIVAMKSLDGEVVPLKRKVKVTSDVEVWLGKLADEMKDTLKECLMLCLKDAKTSRGGLDPQKYPSQILCLAEYIKFTESCEEAIRKNSLRDLQNEVMGQLEGYTNVDLEGVQSTEANVLQLKLKALILDTIHNMDVVDQLVAANVKSVQEWQWQKQLRYYIRKDGVCVMQMVDSEFEYTFEYQGNAAKLVHTPLTDKCYLTLTQGMHMGLGGNPYGPAGTGKTESVKALGGLFGRQVLVFNCDEGIDVKSMGRIFIGLVKCGAWGCFDEFNRLEEAVLSAVSMQIQVIQDAIKNKAKAIELLERNVNIDHNSGIFITMNPAGKGYGGRQKLPDNLKQLFRPVAMTKPDNDLIAEVILFSEGFKQAKNLGRKLVSIFNLSKELLTPQQHYDWGLRALKTVLSGCGNLLQLSKKSGNVKVDANLEAKLVVQALRINTLSKLTFADSSRFDALVRDVFPGVEFKDIEYETLGAAFKEVCAENNLIVNDNQVKKALELYEQLRQRMGVVVVGPSGSGKTTLWKILRQAMMKLGKTVKQYVMNPKAMPRTQLLGQIDMDTREWTDGVLTYSARQVVREPQEVQSWIICDGDIDPEWIESLNSVLDDNRLLTMPSGERIQFGPNVNFLFETHDLSCASPATISRMGMIFLSDEDVDVKALVNAWLKTQEESDQQLLSGWIEDHFYRALQWVLKQNDLVVETSLVGIVLNGLSHLHHVTSKAHFAVCLIHGLGGNLTEGSREIFAKEVFSWCNESPPDPRRPLDTFFDNSLGRLMQYNMEKAEELRADNFLSSMSLPVIRTGDVQRALDYFLPWLDADTRQPFIICGPEGCGKGLLLRHAFEKLRSTQVAMVHCSAQTNPSHILQKLGQTCMVISTNTGRVYRPKDCERLLLYLKDINLPKPDKWGTCQMIAFLQQVVTYNGFYDSNLEWVGLEGVQIVASMNAGSTLGRHKLTTRFTSVVRICNVGYPDRDQLQTIYAAYLKPILNRQLAKHAVWGSSSKVSALANSMIQFYEQLRSRFTVDDYSHYLFTPRDLTNWAMSLLRYDLTDGSKDNTADTVLEVWAYEARRLFRDRIVGQDNRSKFDSMLQSVVRSDWSTNIFDDIDNTFFVTWGARSDSGVPAVGAGAPLPPHGKPLGKLSEDDLKTVIEKGIRFFSHENRQLDILIFKEVLEHMARVDRVLTKPGGSLLMAGSSGVGRRTAVSVVAHMHQMQTFSPKVFRGYGIKQFKNDLKQVMQLAGIEGEQVVLILEDHQFVEPQFLELINSLLSAGEVPGLYSPEELEPLLSPLRDMASEVGFRGTMISFFSTRVMTNLHIVLIMDNSNSNFILNCESNPAFYKQCAVQWMEGWCRDSMLKVPLMLLTRPPKIEGGSIGEIKGHKKKLSGGDELLKSFLHIHESCQSLRATPRKYMIFLKTYQSVYEKNKHKITDKQRHLQAGVSKLNDAKVLVDDLKKKAGEQSILLAEKQAEADGALKEITISMQNAGDQKVEMEELKKNAAEENKILEKRKKAIDVELAEVEPLVQEARRAVGSIKNESLSEIRALRAPPDVIRDILEGVLRLMGIFDTSWVSMKSFLAKRGVKEEIQTFDARTISPEIRKSVEELLRKNKDSFDAKNAKRASQAAEPLAAWVVANVKYSYVLEKIEPLEAEQNELKRNLDKVESRMSKLSQALGEVDRKVATLRNRFETLTKEAAELKIKLDRENETIDAAETLVTKLEGEYQRWNQQVGELTTELQVLPKRAQLAAAFITYLSAAPEDQRRNYLKQWQDTVGVDKFDLRRFLSTESEQLIWKSEGLPSDDLSMENALVILQVHDIPIGSSLRPFLIDPSSRATEWLKVHLKANRLEVINQQDANFSTSLELAVRFGKTLIIQEVDGVEPILFPLLRGDLTAQGPRFVVQIGEKTIDYNEEFRLFLTTRNPNPEITPDAAAIITEVNFTTTRAGLTGQLLASTLQHEKPELELRKTELLKQEEDLKIQLANLESSLLEELANAKGNILENKELLDSLNKTKASSITITESLVESVRLQSSLDQERNTYLGLAESGSCLYFVISDLAKINNMYKFSLASFLRLFQRALQSKHDGSSTDLRLKTLSSKLLMLVYEYVCRSLFKADRMMYAMHMVHGFKPELFEENEWEAFTGVLVADVKGDGGKTISWVDEERYAAAAAFKANFPKLYQTLDLEDTGLWSNFSRSSQCEQEFPSAVERKISLFHQVLVTQATRPDRLMSSMGLFACRALNMKELSPPSVNLKKIYQESISTEPILIVISPGADPSQELQELATETIGFERYHQVAMGQGQAEVAMKLIRECAKNGDWLCLKNLHLVTAWLPALEKEINTMQPHNDFRLWLTSEVHPRVPTILLQSSLKITYEAPPGVKRNLMRTYESWTPDYIARGGSVLRAQSLFALAWFHAVMQERRVYIPQGWTKFYEFSTSDLRAGADIIDRLFKGELYDDNSFKHVGTEGQDQIQWKFVHGLFEFAIYGGRVDNPLDMGVMVSYLQQFFNNSVIAQQNKGKRLGPLKVPTSTNIRDFVDVIESLPEFDKPSYFGLPENIERSAQRSSSAAVISQLRILQRSDAKASKFDKDVWATELGPILNLWKKVNQGQTLIQMKVNAPSEKVSNESPVLTFIKLESYNAIKLVQSIHTSLAALSKVIRGTQLLTSDVQMLAAALLNQETPLDWLNKWDGPEDPVQYLRGLVSRAAAIQKWVERAESGALLRETLDLSELFKPDTFLNAFRQQIAREMKCSMDSLKFVCSWRGSIQGARTSIKVGGLMIEGCTFDGSRLSENQRDSPTVVAIPPCIVSWIPKESPDPYGMDDVISLPVYYSSTRDRIVTRLDVPCGGNVDQWLQTGAALFLKND
ncbi:cytoplasmic dynein 2 heavy chain 1-like isoform X1 [Biomphalaria glabrata]|uniref:Cytoplasmic dynein 2 heavy chain 1 n=1 Tax=Biomphalaria glabrata TaxID=6526 RepID=A0A9W3B784_BIOGL|nr:cytoplasmic dynein 2 heavy chain 1-like isoform X1 [Biomphalaria glabrata]XP_055895256.1 cytoplasmic dynein 2 heavy chain 1-like isoform X1 [Biomphalaria glabrata]